VTIRFANFSQLVRSANGDINQLFSSHLMALLGGYLSNSSEAEKKGGPDMLDKSEEAMLLKNGVSPSIGGAGAASDNLSSW
jgi:hypothetical protein